MLPLLLHRASGLALTIPLPFCCSSSMWARLQNRNTTDKAEVNRKGRLPRALPEECFCETFLPRLFNNIGMWLSEPMASVATKDRQRWLFWHGFGACYCNEGIALVQQSHDMWHRHRCRQSGGAGNQSSNKITAHLTLLTLILYHKI